MSGKQAQTSDSVNPMALTLHDLARLLSAAGERAITTAMLEADVEAGAPVHADGTMNMVHYAAWLAGNDRDVAS